MRKRIYILAILLLPSTTMAQEENWMGRLDFYAGADIPNLVRGGKVLSSGERRNAQAVDFRGGLLVNYDFWRAGVFIEYFPEIDFKGAGIELGIPIRVKDVLWDSDLVIIPSLEGMWVNREGLPKNTYSRDVTIGEYFNHSYGLGIQFDQLFNNQKWAFELYPVITYRMDIYQIWGDGKAPDGYFRGLWEGRGLYFRLIFEILRY